MIPPCLSTCWAISPYRLAKCSVTRLFRRDREKSYRICRPIVAQSLDRRLQQRRELYSFSSFSARKPRATHAVLRHGYQPGRAPQSQAASTISTASSSLRKSSKVGREIVALTFTVRLRKASLTKASANRSSSRIIACNRRRFRRGASGILRNVLIYFDRALQTVRWAFSRTRWPGKASRPRLQGKHAVSDHAASFMDCVRKRNLPKADRVIGTSAEAIVIAVRGRLTHCRYPSAPASDYGLPVSSSSMCRRIKEHSANSSTPSAALSP